MAKAYKCDRCGKLYEDNLRYSVTNGDMQVQLSGIAIYTAGYSIHKSYDLCDDCIGMLREFLRVPGERND